MDEASVSVAGYRAGSAIAMGGGAAAAALLMQGPLWSRITAGLIGGLLAFVATPLLAPIVEQAFVVLYGLAGVSPASLPRSSVEGVTGFGVALTGIDMCRWLIDRTKGLLATLKLPFPRAK